MPDSSDPSQPSDPIPGRHADHLISIAELGPAPILSQIIPNLDPYAAEVWLASEAEDISFALENGCADAVHVTLARLGVEIACGGQIKKVECKYPYWITGGDEERDRSGEPDGWSVGWRDEYSPTQLAAYMLYRTYRDAKDNPAKYVDMMAYRGMTDLLAVFSAGVMGVAFHGLGSAFGERCMVIVGTGFNTAGGGGLPGDDDEWSGYDDALTPAALEPLASPAAGMSDDEW